MTISQIDTVKEEVKIHNHGYLRLVNILGDDFSPARAARMSYMEGSKGEKLDTKLTGFLLKNKHTSPFEQVTVQWEVKAPIFVFREWHRHRTASLNEMSGRYTVLPDEWYIPEEWRIQDTKNKQSSLVTDNLPEWQKENYLIYGDSVEKAFEAYHALLEQGVAKEMARFALPVSTYSVMVWSCNLHNLWHFLNLRTAKNAQKEIRDYAQQMVEMLSLHLPKLMELWKRENKVQQILELMRPFAEEVVDQTDASYLNITEGISLTTLKDQLVEA